MSYPPPYYVDDSPGYINRIIDTYGFAILASSNVAVSYTHLRAHETEADLVCRLLLE